MHLPQPFFKIPRRFDVARLAQEVRDMPPEAWAPHPNGIPGNSSVRLISVDGGENDLVEGPMRETPHFKRAPYIRQILASFNVPWSRTRLLRLAPGAGVPAHADINYHWFYRVRLHIPIVTRPEVRFHCDTTSVHMAAGDAWVFDNWRLHHVVNPTPAERIHLVSDTAGNAAFWQLVGAGEPAAQDTDMLPFRPEFHATLLTERSTLRPVMNPAELELLVGNLRGELTATTDPSNGQWRDANDGELHDANDGELRDANDGELRDANDGELRDANDGPLRLTRYHALLDAFVRDWRHCYVLNGEDPCGWPDFRALRDALQAASRPLAQALTMRTNGVAAHQVLEGRVLRVCLNSVAGDLKSKPRALASQPRRPLPLACNPAAADAALKRPLIIVAAPRSGSTLLFETLAASAQLATLGGEAHSLVESIADLRPGAPGVDSNRLVARQATPAVIDRIKLQIRQGLVDREGQARQDQRGIRFLEKTPKNALRIPFFNRVFPDALWIYLWREPRGNISSIIDAWGAGKWRTYPRLEGFALPWSLLLPPGWQAMRGKPLEEVAAFQWSATNGTVLDDLSMLPAARWTIVNYDRFILDPIDTIRCLCRFADLEYDAGLIERLSRPLPPAKHTLTPPDPQKWQRNAAAVQRVLPLVEPTWNRLRSLGVAASKEIIDQCPN